MHEKDIRWTLKPFDRLIAEEVYRILRLRSRVFVVEQQCIYLDEDNKDQQAFHLMAWQGELLAAYARLLAPGDHFKEASIGRIVTAPEVRRTGIGKLLMKEAMTITYRLYGKGPLRIAAQYYLQGFYHSFGFEKAGDIFLEDGIEHIEMLLK